VPNLAVPIPRTFSVGEYETAAYFNANVRDMGNFLLGLPIATVFQTATQTLTASGTQYPVTFDSAAVDSYGGHSGTTNPSRYTAQVSGWYMVTGTVFYNPSTAGTYRKAQMAVNGTKIAYATSQAPQVNSSTNGTGLAIAPTIVFLDPGDYVEIWASADVAGLGITPNPLNESYMTIFWVHN